ncbi:hypothetical protein UY3_00275 [Chelonia mydas]|uniref:Uncharacterized protein n=1 Tax=Chelonia mydas TaxID=8469 RepID=M7BX67_CHEMY|nr:hypothetical protein UY3_00275 [Chelonia mydas]
MVHQHWGSHYYKLKSLSTLLSRGKPEDLLRRGAVRGTAGAACGPAGGAVHGTAGAAYGMWSEAVRGTAGGAEQIGVKPYGAVGQSASDHVRKGEHMQLSVKDNERENVSMQHYDCTEFSYSASDWFMDPPSGSRDRLNLRTRQHNSQFQRPYKDADSIHHCLQYTLEIWTAASVYKTLDKFLNWGPL